MSSRAVPKPFPKSRCDPTPYHNCYRATPRVGHSIAGRRLPACSGVEIMINDPFYGVYCLEQITSLQYGLSLIGVLHRISQDVGVVKFSFQPHQSFYAPPTHRSKGIALLKALKFKLSKYTGEKHCDSVYTSSV